MILTRQTDEAISALFSNFHPFSKHLVKREDNQLRDKYDHNSFFYTGQPDLEEIRRALAYQKGRGDSFLKLEGYTPLENSFGMAPEVTWTMALPAHVDISCWHTNHAVQIQKPDFEQLEKLELAYYGPLYGEDFTVRNNRRLREKLTYHGAYLGNQLVGCCYSYAAGSCVCMDSLLVASDSRHQHVATTLIQAVAGMARQNEKMLYLHADAEDTPKDMYARMGFVTVDRSYEYLCTDFQALKLG